MIKVIGAGLAGAEAAYFLASHGLDTLLIDMKPRKFTPAHSSDLFAELVCSNSLKSNDVYGNACGLLKEEMRALNSLIMEAADASRIPAGGALAVDRDKFSQYVTNKLKACPHLVLRCEEVLELPEEGIVATGPLTAGRLYEDIQKKFGGALHFFDASAPIVAADSLDLSATFCADRYGKGSDDYINCPLTKDEYENFVSQLLSAEKAQLHAFEKSEIFEGCMPIEVMASRGPDTLRFGTFKPVGLKDADGKRPYAVLQLRRENEAGTCFGLVGCQTNLTFPEQRRVFSLIPALKNAEFLRYGVMHRNTYLNAPKVLQSDFSVKLRPNLFFAGQITGVEGYVESAMSGLVAAIHLRSRLEGRAPVVFPNTCVSGALSQYISTPNPDFQPMNANYGILADSFSHVRDKKEKRKLLALRALDEIQKIKVGAGL